MSSQPFGLNENPFTESPEITLEEATVLIHSRVAAAGGDPARLFPPETCAEIHRFARGKRGGVFALAGRAMRIADREGADSISVEHVLSAVAEAGREAAATSDPSSQPQSSEPQGSDPLPAWEPPVQGGFELPSAPSEDLDPDAREWVSRFLSPQTAQARTLGVTPSPAKPAPAPSKAPTIPVPPKSDARPGAPRPSASPAVATAAPSPAAASPTPAARPRARRSSRAWPSSGQRGRRGRRGMAQWLIGAMAVVAIGLVIVHRLPRAEKAATAVHGAVAPASESAPVTAVIPSPAIAAPAATAPPKPARTRRTATSASAEGQATQVPGIAVTPERDGSQTAGGRLAVEVATFIFEDRAETERDRLVAAGQDARVLTESENGAPSYRVVVGSFRSHRAANRAADALLSGGLVQQARVVTLPSE